MTPTILIFHMIIIPVVFALGRLSSRITFLRVRTNRQSNRIEIMGRSRE